MRISHFSESPLADPPQAVVCRFLRCETEIERANYADYRLFDLVLVEQTKELYLFVGEGEMPFNKLSWTSSA